MLGKYYKITLHNKRCFTGVLVALDKNLNVSMANTEEVVDTKLYNKCINYSCYLCQTGTKRWGIVNILAKDIDKIDELD